MTTLEFNNQLTGMEDRLVSFAMKMTLNRENARDLLQETYLKALNHKDQYVENNNFKAWIFTIMRNSFINDYRKFRRMNTVSDTAIDPYLYNNSCLSQHDFAYQGYSLEEINHFIDALDEKFKVPFRMFIAGYEYKEIAEMLQVKIGTVKSRIFLCRKKLSDIINGNS